MKLLLLYPPDKNLIDTGLPKILEEGTGFSPPLGILYLASSVEQRTNWEVSFVDCAAERLTFEQIRARIDEAKPDMLGVTVTTHQLIDCIEIAKIAKKLDPGIKVIFGGPHVHIYPKETLGNDFVDFVITGEAEFSIVDFLNSWDKPAMFGMIPGLYFKSSSGIFSGPPPVIISDLDNIPYPDRAISKYRLYTSPLVKKEMVTSMITSRGCPFQCIYCNRPSMGDRFRARSAKNVIDEMQECLKLGIKHIKIYDDTFTIERKRVFDICDEIRRRRLNVTWDIRAHINTVDFEMLKRLRQSGCTLICYGVESGVDAMLKRIRKGITSKSAAGVFSMTRKAGIQTLAYFMIGLPNETRQQMLETIEFAKKIKPDFCHFAILVPFPATPVYTEGLASGILSGDYWKEFAKVPTLEFKPELWVENVSRADMESLLLKAYKEFYMRFSYIAKRMFEIRSFSEFKRKLQSGLCLFRVNDEIKRILDLIIAVLLLLCLSPLLVILAVIIKLTSSGQVLYWSDRVGKDNKIFRMCKFRTMRVDTPAVATHLFKDAGRYLTPIGYFLRKYSMDELPQLFNIVSGDMTFVGPRPALFNQDDLISLRTKKGVHKCVPGVTGWAQINGRDDLPISVKADFDEYYVKHRSFALDMKILFITILRVVKGENVQH